MTGYLRLNSRHLAHGQFYTRKSKPVTCMKPVRMWGHGPYSVAVIHGGPGAPGEMAPVARELSMVTGILEPFQTEMTLDLQVQELSRFWRMKPGYRLPWSVSHGVHFFRG